MGLLTTQDRLRVASPNQPNLGVALNRLHDLLGERLSTGEAVRLQHAHTINWIPPQPPDAVVFPMSTAEVARIVSICAEHCVPMIPFGTGSSLEGHVNAPSGGVSISTRDMKGILAVHTGDLDVTVEAGVTRTQLNAHLRDTGLFFPIDPGADASLGGMASTRASGTNAVRYGTMKDAVIGLTAVLPNGQVAHMGGRARKSSAGYDLTRLLVGAEGTLGIITELTLRLYGIPESVAAGICPFPSLAAACNAVILAIQSGIPAARIELLDEVQIKACNKYSNLTLAEQPTLFLEFHGGQAAVAEQVASFRAIAEDLGGQFQSTERPEERSKLWQARHDAHWAALALRPGCKNITTDVCVPISRLAECVTLTKEDIEQSGLVAPVVGHVGDGNFHVLPLLDLTDPGEIERVKRFVDRLVERALAMDGTCTGEHGIGQEKQQYLVEEMGPVTLSMMRSIKQALDPLNLMNPGKVFAV